MDTKAAKQPDKAKPQGERTQRTPLTWGLSAADFYAGLQNKPVKVELVNSKSYIGELIGHDVYDIFLRQASGLVILVPKHAITLLFATTNGSAQAEGRHIT